MKIRRNRLRAPLALLLILALNHSLFASPKPLDSAAVHAKIIKRGVDHFITVKEDNGILLTGKILNIGEKSFSLQISGDSHPTEVYYADVTQVGASGGHRTGIIAFIVITAVGVGVAIGLAVHFHNQQPKLPPIQPVIP